MSVGPTPAVQLKKELSKPSIMESATSNNSKPCSEVIVIHIGWTQPLTDYIRNHKLPEEKVEAEQIVGRNKLCFTPCWQHFIQTRHQVWYSHEMHIRRRGDRYSKRCAPMRFFKSS